MFRTSGKTLIVWGRLKHTLKHYSKKVIALFELVIYTSSSGRVGFFHSSVIQKHILNSLPKKKYIHLENKT